MFVTDAVGVKCANLEREPIDKKDIETILEWHNVYRNNVASGIELRGNPGPQRPAKFMLELVCCGKNYRFCEVSIPPRALNHSHRTEYLFRQVWDDELADIARRWALQCNLFEKDQCRDVGKYLHWIYLIFHFSHFSLSFFNISRAQPRARLF
ncbi:venom allergen 5 [Halictus rubicundus]|uniref:venom allergen 5 n=1 Tax=Halictus rubicundus TaxID=77578 RepID=UPI0040366F5F